MIYIGDSDTDIPCMKLINSHSGHSIGVYKMMHDKRIKYFAAADYFENSELDSLVKAIIDKTKFSELLESIHYSNKVEFNKNDEDIGAEYKIIRDLIILLENSNSFKTTHLVIAKLKKYHDFTDSEKKWLIDLADQNSQINAIITDPDVKSFYTYILDNMSNLTEKAKKIQQRMIEN